MLLVALTIYGKQFLTPTLIMLMAWMMFILAAMDPSMMMTIGMISLSAKMPIFAYIWQFPYMESI
jgi:hypothetical protein